jgi:hypothetical protein
MEGNLILITSFLWIPILSAAGYGCRKPVEGKAGNSQRTRPPGK